MTTMTGDDDPIEGLGEYSTVGPRWPGDLLRTAKRYDVDVSKVK